MTNNNLPVGYENNNTTLAPGFIALIVVVGLLFIFTMMSFGFYIYARRRGLEWSFCYPCRYYDEEEEERRRYWWWQRQQQAYGYPAPAPGQGQTVTMARYA
ncbi:hypothetical protein BGW36DRAFT_410637 [Talaromyces proteolyticus]|uniref:Uncharacterized protein n=1 Tax=Talaromyces proteolyticus TaxID=1131652 RepID=A0AAD4PW60_9EURO|nr:uncharacterized protein BGW36DRAFT_410637 [Talaromyces proteolyticus]KAH8692143.1 hypothetical protein BGW36DRAFT_410637 [Talaromyces proteolyticus]